MVDKMKQKFNPQGSDNLIVNQNIINEIKKDYIHGKETKSLLFKKYGLKYGIDRLLIYGNNKQHKSRTWNK